MATENLAHPELHADEIRWELGPALDVAPDDLAFEFAEGYKAIAQEALHALATVTKERNTLRRTVRELRELLRGCDRWAA